MNNVFLPPEWYPQYGVMLTWPHVNTDWKPILSQVEPVFCEIARQIANYEQVIIVCYDEIHRQHIQSMLSNIPSPKIHFYCAPSDDTWARDHGPLTVFKNHKPIVADFTFNGWGNKFSATQDNQITRLIHQQNAFGKAEIFSTEFVLEGGSIEVDGEGTLLTTARCLLAKTRNPHLTAHQIEDYLMNHLGINRIFWLKQGFLLGDDTDSHIDTLARFTDPKTICYVSCDDKNDVHYAELTEMAEALKQFKTARGEPYRLIPLPWPSPKYDQEGHRLPATYANFLIINGAVLVPIYEDPRDNDALKQIGLCFPDSKIIGINCLPLIQQGGSLHCLTMQLPLYSNAL